mgnify:CR=1 FL=1
MKTSLDCLPCLLKQALSGARLAAPDDPDVHRAAVMSWAEAFSGLDLDRSPPDLAGDLYKLLSVTTGHADPFAAYKAESNRRALEMLPRLEKLVQVAPDPLETALALAIIGNYLDPGAPHQVDFARALEMEASDGLAGAELESLRDTAASGGEILILGDNCGEIVLDKLLVAELAKLGAKVAYAVRGAPVLNDATMDDARAVGMDRLCEVVSSGSEAPGTVMSRCTTEFAERMRSAGLVLSKGQGNFEALAGELPGVVFAFKVKCPVVAAHIGCEQGASIFRRL